MVLLSRGFLFLCGSANRAFSTASLQGCVRPAKKRHISYTTVSPIYPIQGIIYLILHQGANAPSRGGKTTQHNDSKRYHGNFTGMGSGVLGCGLFIGFFGIFFQQGGLRTILLLCVGVVVHFTRQPEGPPVFFLTTIYSLVRLVVFRASN